MSLRPNSDLVVATWLGGLAGLNSQMVVSTLPQDNTTAAASGLVQYTVVGGSPNVYLPQNAPVVRIDCWALNAGSVRPPWGKANQLAEIVKANSYLAPPRLVTLPSGYTGARILSIVPLSEPRRVLGDPGNFARYTMDLRLFWVSQ